MDRGHAGCGGAAGLGPLDQRQPLLQHCHGGVAEAGILVVLIGAGEGRLGLLGAVVDEAGGQEQRLGGLAELAALGAAMHEQGGGAELAGSIGSSFVGPCMRWPDRWSSGVGLARAVRWPL